MGQVYEKMESTTEISEAPTRGQVRHEAVRYLSRPKTEMEIHHEVWSAENEVYAVRVFGLCALARNCENMGRIVYIFGILVLRQVVE